MFIFRDFGTLGGLLMIVAEVYLHGSSNKISGSTSILETSEHEQKRQKKSYLLLIGRILMLFMYLPKVFVPLLEAENFSVITSCPSFIIESIVGVFLIICVFLGYKTKLASLSLIIWLAFWTSFGRTPPWLIQWDVLLRDTYSHLVLQTLSTIGGLLMLGQMGAGTLSVDERKKNF